MAAVPTLNRCQYHFRDDRQCRRPICAPGLPYCAAHEKMVERDLDRIALNPPPPPPHATSDLFMRWLAEHPLDSASHVNLAMQQLLIMLAARRVTYREAQIHLTALRVYLKTISLVRGEVRDPRIYLPHQAATQQALAETCQPLLSAIESDRREEESATAAAATSAVAAELAKRPNSNCYIVPDSPPPTVDDCVRKQREFLAAAREERAAYEAQQHVAATVHSTLAPDAPSAAGSPSLSPPLQLLAPSPKAP